MAILARADAAAITDLIPGPLPHHARLRGPETGLVMLRGRAGGDGAPFNLGEATATRCSVRLADGAVGHAWRLGRDTAAAEASAVLDALLQDPKEQAALLDAVIAPLAAAQAEANARLARRAEATRVNFFTMAAMRS
ncbi:phosphonate C-P lyase system protein PhnG [Humitalea sp. 24SJ18S-53]|uniref:phosphonate C-P lyase system protein PhnG n=1 Tax=Humitalea sp. 24SJ18S-53 TaxID=3422307 RepID=UPI003D6655BD